MVNTKFNEVKAEHMERLEQFTPIVARVHGEKHPEFLKVQQLFNQLNEKLKADEATDLDADFKGLRKVTNNYQLPSDVCESYEAVYTMLEDLDQAYFVQ